ncbi:MAG: hypothetical protein ACXWTW_09905, partial [Methylobacter sp.]
IIMFEYVPITRRHLPSLDTKTMTISEVKMRNLKPKDRLIKNRPSRNLRYIIDIFQSEIKLSRLKAGSAGV